MPGFGCCTMPFCQLPSRFRKGLFIKKTGVDSGRFHWESSIAFFTWSEILLGGGEFFGRCCHGRLKGSKMMPQILHKSLNCLELREFYNARVR